MGSGLRADPGIPRRRIQMPGSGRRPDPERQPPSPAVARRRRRRIESAHRV